MRVLLVEDDAVLGSAIKELIASDGHGVDWVQRLGEAADYLSAAHYDLVLLDFMLPDGLGLDFLKQRRRVGDQTPVIVLTALGNVSDRIAGLNAGADDYLAKPFDLDELTARISAVARRYVQQPNPILKIGELAIDRSTKMISKDGKSIGLTAREWAIFDELLKRPTAIISKERLEDCLYNFDHHVESNTIEVYIGRIRKKLGASIISTVRGMGYRLALPFIDDESK